MGTSNLCISAFWRHLRFNTGFSPLLSISQRVVPLHTHTHTHGMETVDSINKGNLSIENQRSTDIEHEFLNVQASFFFF